MHRKLLVDLNLLRRRKHLKVFVPSDQLALTATRHDRRIEIKWHIERQSDMVIDGKVTIVREFALTRLVNGAVSDLDL